MIPPRPDPNINLNEQVEYKFGKISLTFERN